MNMTTAMGYIKGKSTVSVPELMHEKGLNYTQARGIVNVLTEKGAIRYCYGVTYVCVSPDESEKTPDEKKSNVSRANPYYRVGGACAGSERAKASEKIEEAYRKMRQAMTPAPEIPDLVYSKIRKLPNTRVERSDGKLIIYSGDVSNEICIEFWSKGGYRYVYKDNYEKINEMIESSDIGIIARIKGIADSYGVTLMANYMYKEVRDASEIVAYFLNMQIAVEEIFRLNK